MRGSEQLKVDKLAVPSRGHDSNYPDPGYSVGRLRKKCHSILYDSMNRNVPKRQIYTERQRVAAKDWVTEKQRLRQGPAPSFWEVRTGTQADDCATLSYVSATQLSTLFILFCSRDRVSLCVSLTKTQERQEKTWSCHSHVCAHTRYQACEYSRILVVAW